MAQVKRHILHFVLLLLYSHITNCTFEIKGTSLGVLTLFNICIDFLKTVFVFRRLSSLLQRLRWGRT